MKDCVFSFCFLTVGRCHMRTDENKDTMKIQYFMQGDERDMC